MHLADLITELNGTKIIPLLDHGRRANVDC